MVLHTRTHALTFTFSHTQSHSHALSHFEPYLNRLKFWGPEVSRALAEAGDSLVCRGRGGAATEVWRILNNSEWWLLWWWGPISCRESLVAGLFWEDCSVF